MTAEYDEIGKTYTSTRLADPRISQQLIDLLSLPTGSRIVDVGAGSGNYSLALAVHGFRVTAVEPSAVMREQAQAHRNLSWQAASAESLPFDDAQFDGAVMTLCLHHFVDWRQGLREALRVTGGGPLVIFAFDIEHKANFWLFDYFPDFIEIDRGWSATSEKIAAFVEQDLQSTFESTPFPLPKDLCDHFAAAGWARPEIYLQLRYRSGISSFSKLNKQALDQGLKQLRDDLKNGRWQQKYGSLLDKEFYDRGYVFLSIGNAR